jgi:peptidoglycan/LPS O-acetylase OafA/YrhL
MANDTESALENGGTANSVQPSNVPVRWAPALPSRIPSLDGLRAVSILAVVVGHGIPLLHAPWLAGLLVHLGNYGVRIFFLISGFLITTILLKEWDAKGAISLRNFYIRRALRIFPAFYVYVGVVALLAGLGYIVLYPGDLLHALTYTMNYHMKRAWYLNHIWSLAVEEQFYLLWPAALYFAGPWRARAGVASVLLLAPLIRLGMVVFFDASPTALMRHFQAVSDALATGCCWSFIWNWLGRQPNWLRFQATPAYLLGAVGLICCSAILYLIHPLAFYIPGQTLANLGGILLLDYCVRRPKSWLGLLMNWRPMAIIGVWSYSIYLWQELLLDTTRPGIEIPFPLNLIGTFAVSAASYYFIEMQFLKLKDRFMLTGTGPKAGDRG